MARKYQMCALAYACQAFISFRDHDYYVRFEIFVYIFGDIADVCLPKRTGLLALC